MQLDEHLALLEVSKTELAMIEHVVALTAVGGGEISPELRAQHGSSVAVVDAARAGYLGALRAFFEKPA